jgi:hypothetical protein
MPEVDQFSDAVKTRCPGGAPPLRDRCPRGREGLRLTRRAHPDRHRGSVMETATEILDRLRPRFSSACGQQLPEVLCGSGRSCADRPGALSAPVVDFRPGPMPGCWHPGGDGVRPSRRWRGACPPAPWMPGARQLARRGRGFRALIHSCADLEARRTGLVLAAATRERLSGPRLTQGANVGAGRVRMAWVA